MYLVVGLGNPGTEYEKTPHNVGFFVLDLLIKFLKVSEIHTKFQGEFLRTSVGEVSCLLLKPQTFMNLSGRSVQACAQFYKIPLHQIIVISDDLDLPIGKVRFRNQGGHGGHNGLRSIIECLGSDCFNRIRVGIGRPNHQSAVKNYVLSPWSSDHLIHVERIAELLIQQLIPMIRNQQFENTSLSVD